MQQPVVSIVVPCYKKAQYLSEALDSVLAQSYSVWECVIVNDGSPDNTEEIAMAYCQRDARFHYLAQPNQGVSAARNNGIRLLQGKYILTLDADDWISPTYLEKAVSCLEESPEVKAVYSRCELFGSFGKREWVMPEYSYERFVMGDMAIVCSAVYRRTDFDHIGGYDESFQGYEDWDFWLSLLKKEDVVVRLDELLFHYRNDSSIISNMVSQNVKALRNKLCKKHEDIYQPMFADLLYYYGLGQELEAVKKDLERTRKVYSSHAYQLGKLMMKPFSFLKRRLRREAK